jgi:predicted ArsR family transcriptional regulator
MTEPPLDDTWHNREIPTLTHAARLIEEAEVGMGARLHDIAAASGLSEEDTHRSLKALEDAGLIEVRWVMPARAGRVVRVSAGARQLVGMWPNPETAFDRILAALETIAGTSSGQVQSDANQALEALRSSGDALRQSIGAAGLGDTEQA